MDKIAGQFRLGISRFKEEVSMSSSVPRAGFTPPRIEWMRAAIGLALSLLLLVGGAFAAEGAAAQAGDQAGAPKSGQESKPVTQASPTKLAMQGAVGTSARGSGGQGHWR